MVMTIAEEKRAKAIQRLENHQVKLKNKYGDNMSENKLFKDDGKILKDTLILADNSQKINKRGRPLKYATDEMMKEHVKSYFEICMEKEIIPSVLGLALWLGVHRDTIYEWTNGDYPYTQTIQLAITVIQKWTEDNALLGNLNPVLYIFLGKNYFGLQDNNNVVIKGDNKRLSEQEQNEILAAVPKISTK